ncbi:MAG: cytidine deaminase [Sorangium cellulosum]|nr:MAG: cytidine deaminase [Sorangium cellulosum]
MSSSIDWENLVEAAKDVRSNAYAPYSGFAVGAAILSASGHLFVGCNVENATYGLTICAERNAVANMVASGEREMRAIAIVTGADAPTPPCGMCRQTLAEFVLDLPVYLVSTAAGTVARATTLAALIPNAFRGDMLPPARQGVL